MNLMENKRIANFDSRLKERKMTSINQVKPLEFPQCGDERGHLVVVEGCRTIPFEIKRVFYIYGSDADVVRGEHANRDSEFVLINVSGKSKVEVRDGMDNHFVYSLDRPHMGLYLPRMIWKKMYDFTSDSVLLCLSSKYYDAAEYIRNYEEYLLESRKENSSGN